MSRNWDTEFKKGDVVLVTERSELLAKWLKFSPLGLGVIWRVNYDQDYILLRAIPSNIFTYYVFVPSELILIERKDEV